MRLMKGGRWLDGSFRGNEKMIRKEVERLRKEESVTKVKVKKQDGRILSEKNEVHERWN